MPTRQTKTKLLTIREFAETIGVSTGTIRRWLAQRKLAVIRLGMKQTTTDDRDHRPVRIDIKEIERLTEHIPAMSSRDLRRELKI